MLSVCALQKTFKLNRQQQKIFSSKKMSAVKNIDFTLSAGQIVAIVGSNGAGKSTTLRMLAGLLKPSNGTIEFDHQKNFKQHTGFLSASTELYRRLTVKENLTYFGKLYGVNNINQRINQLAQELEFSHFLSSTIDDCSTGMTQKVNIARSIIHSPKLLILDEPTTGLDLKAAQIVLNFIEQQKKKGVLILFSTHHLHEVEALADQILVIEQGEQQFLGSKETFLAHTSQPNLHQAALWFANQKGAL